MTGGEVFDIVNKLIITLGVGYLVKGQKSIQEKARLGREAIHKRINEIVEKKIDPTIIRQEKLETKCEERHKEKKNDSA